MITNSINQCETLPFESRVRFLDSNDGLPFILYSLATKGVLAQVFGLPLGLLWGTLVWAARYEATPESILTKPVQLLFTQLGDLFSWWIPGLLLGQIAGWIVAVLIDELMPSRPLEPAPRIAWSRQAARAGFIPRFCWGALAGFLFGVVWIYLAALPEYRPLEAGAVGVLFGLNLALAAGLIGGLHAVIPQKVGPLGRLFCKVEEIDAVREAVESLRSFAGILRRKTWIRVLWTVFRNTERFIERGVFWGVGAGVLSTILLSGILFFLVWGWGGDERQTLLRLLLVVFLLGLGTAMTFGMIFGFWAGLTASLAHGGLATIRYFVYRLVRYPFTGCRPSNPASGWSGAGS